MWSLLFPIKRFPGYFMKSNGKQTYNKNTFLTNLSTTVVLWRLKCSVACPRPKCVYSSVTQLHRPKVRPLSLRVQHPRVGHVDKQGVAVLQPDASALLGAVHVVGGVVPAHGAARLHEHHRLAVFDALVVDVLDELGVANIHGGGPGLAAAHFYYFVVAEAGLGVNVVEAGLHHQQFALLVIHSVAVSALHVPVDGDGLRLALCVETTQVWLCSVCS